MSGLTASKDYIAVASEYRTEYVIEKSRFIATIAPCQTEEEAQAFIGRIKKEFWDARHNCTAFALGPRQEQQRSSDDGEPSGTAGKPILEVLKKTGLTNAAIVVTRYFGGIKLGAGGLIRAYSHSASLAVQGAPKELHTSRTLLHVSLDYNQYGPMERFLQDQNLSFESSFGSQVELTAHK
ncbi:MAG: YigZ family protein [Veillonella sp.]|nr:YigZ family protein [Veillonella sp.]